MSSKISAYSANLPTIKAIILAKIFDIKDNDNEVKNSILPLLLYFSDTTSSVYNKQFKVKSKHNSNTYIEFMALTTYSGGEINYYSSESSSWTFRDNFRTGIEYGIENAFRYIIGKEFQFFFRILIHMIKFSFQISLLEHFL